MKIRCPKQLQGAAKDFWKQHAPRCEAEGTLNEATLHTFVLLARTWGFLEAIDPTTDPKGMLSWNGTTKTYERYAVQFGLFSKKPPEKQEDVGAILNSLMGD